MSLALRQLSTADAGFEAEFQRLLHWSAETDAAIEGRVAQIIADVRARGDAAVLELTARFDGLQAASMSALETGVDGLIVSNTTISRPAGLRSPHARELGGLSGVPLKPLAQQAMRTVARHAAGRLTLIGVGGIATGEDVLARIRAGAHLVQLYTAFAYEGPALIRRLKRELIAALDRQGFASVADAVGADPKDA